MGFYTSEGASGYASENHQGRTTLSTTSPRVLDSCPLFSPLFPFPFFVILLPFIPLPFFRANVPSSTCISDGVIPSYFFSWQLNWISIIGLGMLVLSSSGIDRRFCGFLHRIFFVSFFHECVTMQSRTFLGEAKLIFVEIHYIDLYNKYYQEEW